VEKLCQRNEKNACCSLNQMSSPSGEKQNNKFAKTFFLTLQHQGNINQNHNVSSVCANSTGVWLLCKSEGASENSQSEG